MKYKIGDLITRKHEGYRDSPILESTTSVEQIVKINDNYVYGQTLIYEIKTDSWYKVTDNAMYCISNNEISIWRKNTNGEYERV